MFLVFPKQGLSSKFNTDNRQAVRSVGYMC